MNRFKVQNHILLSVLVVLLFSAASVFSGDKTEQYSGKYVAYDEDEQVFLTIEKTAVDHYKGFLDMDGEKISLSGKKYGQKLIGELNQYSEIIEFIMIAGKDGTLIFEDENGEEILFQSTKTKVAEGKIDDKGFASTENRVVQAKSRREVYFNRVRLDEQRLNTLETMYQTRVENGHYWYDAICGAWGVEEGPTVGFIMAGLDFPGPMPQDISGGGTSIFINGREIHPLDQKGLQQLFGITYPGHYWLDRQGNLGITGGPPFVNIVAAIQNAQKQHSGGGGSTTHGYNSTYGGRGTLANDGQGGHIYSGRTATGKSVFWYPGM